MENELFADTSGFYALLVQRDDKHGKACSLLEEASRKGERFVTTDYVLDETGTLLRTRGLSHLIPSFYEVVFASKACRVEWTDSNKFHEAKNLFIKHLDQHYSFTDCLSFCVMKHFRLKRALTKDGHFREAGFLPLLG